jgi:arabinofuranosyltransferase
MKKGGAESRLLLLLAGVCLLAFAWVAYANAWMSDDGFITQRSIDNLLHGHGLRWNVDERVLVFTDPLWALLLAGAVFLTRESYFTTVVTGMVFSLAAFLLLLRRFLLPAGWPAVAAYSILLLFSKAFIDYTTAGLETSLSYLLVLLFCAVLLRREGRRGDLFVLSLLASLLVLCRPDFAVLLLPPLFFAWRRTPRGEGTLRQLLAGFIPLFLWEAFSLVYFGVLLPNSALAKLDSHVPLAGKILQGGRYFLDSLLTDPLTLLTITAAGASVVIRGRREAWPLAGGVLAYLLFVLAIGGDFMSGRFFAVPFLVSVAMLAFSLPLSSRGGAALLAGVLLAGFLSPWPPPSSRRDFRCGEDHNDVLNSRWGISDERGYYYRAYGLRRVLARADHGFLDPDMLDGRRAAYFPALQVLEGRKMRPNTGVYVMKGAVGALGYFAGPGTHIIDMFAVCDPLLSRLPFEGTSFRPGHLPRTLPQGYTDSISAGRNLVRDPKTALLYDRVRLLTSAPLLDGERWKVILGGGP